MQFYFIRHAQSENNALFDANRSDDGRTDDPELTESGRRQAECLAEYISARRNVRVVSNVDRMNLTGFHLTHLYSSPMVRAVATATAIAAKIGLPVHAWEDAHECGGIYLMDATSGEHIGGPGKNRVYFREQYPAYVLPGEGWDDGWWNRPFEEHAERDPRARRFLTQLLERHGGTDDRVAVVSHGGFYNHLLALIFGIPESEKWWFSIYNSAITRVDFEPRRTVLAYTNQISHLPPDLVT